MTARWRRGLLVLLLLPFVLVAIEARVVAPSMGDAVARQLRDVARAIERQRPGARGKGPARVVSSTSDVVRDAGFDDPTKSTMLDRVLHAAPSGSAPEPARAAAPSGPVRISAGAVQRAIDDDGRTLHARTTFGPDGKPAGARLTGVTGAGLGLFDGDVIVAVDGSPTMTDDDATDAALRAVARGDSRLHATLTRDGHPFEVLLDLPLAPDGANDAGNRPARP